MIGTFRDKETAALVAHDSAAGKEVASRAGETVAVRAKNRKAFRTALRNMGMLLP